MGSCCSNSPLNSGPAGEILQKLDEKWELIQAQLDTSELESKKKTIIEERHKELEKEKDNKENMMKIVKEYNKKELEVDNELIEKQNDKMDKLLDLGLELADEFKKKLIEELEKKLEKAPSMTINVLKNRIAEITALSPKKFLGSEFGKPLLQALEKKGLSKSYMDGYKETLKLQRKERRLKERDEFNINVNEFPDEEVFEDDKGESHFDTIMKEILGGK